MVALISIQIADLNRTDKPLTIVFYFALFSVPMTALALPFVMTAHDTAGWLLLLAIGIAGVIGQLLLTAALRFGAVASVIVMDYSSLFWATLYGWAFFASLPPASTWLGAPADRRRRARHSVARTPLVAPHPARRRPGRRNLASDRGFPLTHSS